MELIACCVIPESAAVIPEFSGAYRRSGVIKEFVERREKMLRLFNVRHMPALVQKHGLRSERAGCVYGRRGGNRIVTTGNDQHRQADTLQTRDQIEIAEALPDGLLHSADDSEGSESVRVA